jgi:hypothetical protein
VPLGEIWEAVFAHRWLQVRMLTHSARSCKERVLSRVSSLLYLKIVKPSTHLINPKAVLALF